MDNSVFTMVSWCALLALLQGCSAASWSSDPREADGQTKYVCTGQALRLPWVYQLDQGQTLREVQWYFHGSSQEIIAIYANGLFETLPAFSHRVQQLTNGGIDMSDVTQDDKGNYSVTVTAHDAAGALFSISRSASVKIIDGLMTTDQTLRARLQPHPQQDPTTHDWSLALTCGNFTYPSHPPFDVIWTTPDGHSILSTDFQSGHFILRLTNPVVGGRYSCQIPSSAVQAACVSGAVTASVNVDAVQVRLSLLEASYTALLAQNVQLLQQVDVLRQQMQAMAGTKQTSFRATLQHDVTSVVAGTHLIFDRVVNNQGEAYSSASGEFSAPSPGSYFLSISTRCSQGMADAEIVTSRQNETRMVCRVDSDVRDDAGSCQGVVQLDAGQKVWVQAFEVHPPASCYRALDTTFTGFLINFTG